MSSPEGVIRIVLEPDCRDGAPLGVLLPEPLARIHLHLEVLAAPQLTDKDIVLQ